MSKAIMISIQPKWCEPIANGKKTIEVRKTRPKLDTPFKVYIYCTLPPKEELFTHGSIREYANELIRLQDGRIVYGYGMQLCCDIENRPYSHDNFLCKKVIGEFVCDRIHPIVNANTRFMYENCDQYTRNLDSCLSLAEMQHYLEHKKGYGWHISNLIIYDRPRELSRFSTFCKGCGSEKDKQCINCPHLNFDNDPISGYTRWCGVNKRKPLIRPPQSWCYVEEANDV